MHFATGRLKPEQIVSGKRSDWSRSVEKIRTEIQIPGWVRKIASARNPNLQSTVSKIS
jgi:hypothetical protein